MSLVFRSFVLVIWILQLFVTHCAGFGDESKRARDLYDEEKTAVLSHAIHRIIKRGVVWNFHGTKPGPEFILPKCPCDGQSQKCQEFDYCYCQLGYPPPTSQVTGETFLKGYYEQCSTSNSSESKPPNFNSLSFLEKYFVAFASPFWDCREVQFLPNQVHHFYPYLCVRKKLIPLKGTFYDIPQPLTPRATKYETRKYFASLKSPKYTWPIQDNKDLRPIRSPGDASAQIKPSSPQNSGWNWQGHAYEVSGGRGCFVDLGVYRRGVSASYECKIRIDPTTSRSREIGCDLMGSILQHAGSSLLNLQLRTLFKFDPNGTITQNPNSTWNAGFIPKVTQYNISVSTRREDADSGIHVCPDQLVGLHLTFVHHGLQLVAAKLGKRTGKQNLLSSVFPIEISFQSVDADSKYFCKLSRFWYEFYHGECMDQFCWRDLLKFPIEDENFGGNVDGVIALLAIPLLGLIMTIILFQGVLPDWI